MQIIGAAAAVLALIVGVVAISLSSSGTASAEVFRAPVGDPGPNAFTSPIKPPASLQEPSLLAALKPFAGALARPKGAAKNSVPSFSGSAPGLYGGTQKLTVCDPKQLVTFLLSNPVKAAAWAGVQGIRVSDIRDYVATLTDVILRFDTRVTNHGFINGRATTIPEILQAGTAVLVDRFGVPRARCYCGNPLTVPQAVKGTPRYSGPTWTGFDPSQKAVILAAAATVTKLVIVDVLTGQPFFRPVSTHGEADTPAPADVLAGSPFVAPPASASATTVAPGTGLPAPAALSGTYTFGPGTASGATCTGTSAPKAAGQQVSVNVTGSTVALGFQGQSANVPLDPSTDTFSLSQADSGAFGLGSSTLKGTFTNLPAGGVGLTLALDLSGCTITLPSTRTGDATQVTTPPTAPPTTAAPAVTDVTSQGAVSASSTFSGKFPASAAVDGDPGTSWFSIGAGDGSSSTFTWQAQADTHIDSITIIGNEHNSDPANRSGFGYAQTEIQVLDSNGAVVYDQSFDGPSNGSNDINATVGAVGRTVKLLLKNRESPDCGGFAELTVRGFTA